MKRTALFWMLLPVGLAAGGTAATACRGGGDLYGDAGTDGNIMGFGSKGSSSDTGDGGAEGDCATALVTIDDGAAADNASSGGPGCANDDDCTVRMEGDYCGCPLTPRPMLTSRATAFDQSLSGITQRCTCPIPSCIPPRGVNAVCRDGRCVLADGGD